MVKAEQHDSCIMITFQVDPCRTTQYFSDYIDSCVKMSNSFPITVGGDRSRTVRQTHLEDVILDHVEYTPGTSTRAVASRLHVNQPTVWRVLLLDC
ncbi:hypothetical protein TNCV_1129041 [Trichonephila clavipes]|nr:hypothetical protein TNCV_1129041 [Trichonephila clavipes]